MAASHRLNPLPAAARLVQAAAIVGLLSLGGCGGGGTDKASGSSTPSTSPAASSPSPSASSPSPAASAPVLPKGTLAFTFSGAATAGRALSNVTVTAYDSKGKVCGTATTDAAGAYTLAATCSLPVLLTADSAATQGKEFFSFVPSGVTDPVQRVNLTPITTMVTAVALGAAPTALKAAPVALMTASSLTASVSKVHEVLDPVLAAMGVADKQDFLSGPIVVGQGQDRLMDVARFIYERVDAAKQNLHKVQLVSEQRPIVLIANDGTSIADAYVDNGLGITPAQVNSQRLIVSAASATQLSDVLTSKNVGEIRSAVDVCFLHNGSKNPDLLFDTPPEWQPVLDVKPTNVRLERFNTFVDPSNETLESLNSQASDLAYVSFDFTNVNGYTQRAYTWLVRGTHAFPDCSTSGADWRVLGNRRPVYIRTNVYALQRQMYDQSYSKRIDSRGTGTEHYIDTPQSRMAVVQVSGPGLPLDGLLFAPSDGTYLRANTTLLSARIKGFGDSIVDERSFAMTDSQVVQVTDAYYHPQNSYVYRFYRDLSDLYPTYTYVDVLPKRPYLNTEVAAMMFPSVALNLDDFSSALQKITPFKVNLQTIDDPTGHSFQASRVFISRLNCKLNKRSGMIWPGCPNRGKQFNEWDAGGMFFGKGSLAQTVLTPMPFPIVIDPPTKLDPDGLVNELKTYTGLLRARYLDSLNRVVEVEVGIEYRR